MKLAFVVCYKQPDYVRAASLRAALETVDRLEVIDIRNHRLGPSRLIEVPVKLLISRFRDKPEAYLVTFRGYEMLLFLVLTFVRKPIIFDELVNFTEWMEENGKLKAGGFRYRLFRRWYGWLTRHSRRVLADTDAHALYSARVNRLPIERYRVIPVGTDETVFYPRTHKLADKNNFTIFYYGSMRPLHGLDHLLEAAVSLKDEPSINFQIVGGKREVEKACAAAVLHGARIAYKPWLAFEELPAAALKAGLTVGGPFGNTTQSQYVITGKTYQFLALGAPVLVGQNEVNSLLKDKVNCLMVPQADADALAEAIKWAHAHPSEMKKIGQQGRHLYEAFFSQKEINKLVSALIDAVLV